MRHNLGKNLFDGFAPDLQVSGSPHSIPTYHILPPEQSLTLSVGLQYAKAFMFFQVFRMGWVILGNHHKSH